MDRDDILVRGHIFDYLDEIQGEMEKRDLVALFIDYDGTLVHFKDRPDEALPSDEIKNTLASLVRNSKFEVVIISGRKMEDLKDMLSIDGLSLSGLHGMQILFSNGESFTWNGWTKSKSLLGSIWDKMVHDFKNIDGIYLENKKMSLAFHYRLLPRGMVRDVCREFEDMVKENDRKGRLEVIHGAEVLEVRPMGWDKGRAVDIFLKHISAKEKDILPLYIGDDATDEDAFIQLKGEGITVIVSGDREVSTSAQFRIKNPDEVIELLRWFLKNV
ncbi:MAG: trehalose-phosphatase [Candidatus Hydrothermarchaeales archaeon]